LHPVLVIVILLVAEKFFGMWGLVLGVPVSIYIIRVVILNSPIPGIYEPGGAPEATLHA
jgi:predicted PurR-regulated permease PerM